MSLLDDTTRLNFREASLSDEVKRPGPRLADGAPCLAASTTTLVSYPTIPSSFFACNPLIILGEEVEGGPGAVTADSSTFLALNLGSSVPPPGTQILATSVGNRWVFRYD